LRLLRYHQLAPVKGITYTRERLRQLELAGKFPKRLKLGSTQRSGQCAWVEHEIDAYIAERMAARDE
jgi:prophage regulatory protein